MLNELEVNIHFEDAERQKPLWTEILQLLTRGRPSRPRQCISFPLMCLPAVVSLLEHFSINVAWYTRELAEKLSEKIKLNSSRAGTVSTDNLMQSLRAIVNESFSLDHDYIARRGKVWNASRDISGVPTGSSVHVRRIMTRKEHTVAKEYHRTQVGCIFYFFHFVFRYNFVT